MVNQYLCQRDHVRNIDYNLVDHKEKRTHLQICTVFFFQAMKQYMNMDQCNVMYVMHRCFNPQADVLWISVDISGYQDLSGCRQ